MPQYRRLTDKQEAAALAEYRADPRRGAIAALARKYLLSDVGMRGCLKRAEQRETQSEVSRETSGAGEEAA